MNEVERWAAYLHEAEADFTLAADRQMGLWISEHTVSEGYLEAVERTAVARSRWQARLIALNAFMDAKAAA